MNITNPGDILVVDDTAENLRLLTSMLGDKGYEIRPVTSGRLALQAAERSVPDLVLLDITMPVMDGYEVCRQLKSRENLRDVPVIFLTALSDTADKLKAFSVGGVDYISKPFQIEEVLARVRVHIALRRAQSELAANYDRLQQLEKIRDNLFHMIVHDMRTPLAIIMGNLELFPMIHQGDHSGQAAQTLDAASLGVSNLVNMTNDLLDVSKMEEGKMSLNREPCDLMVLAKDVAGGISALDQSRSVTVDSNGSVMASCDARVMRRIFQNLIGNAVKHTPTGAAVRVVAHTGQNSLRVSIIDQGAGVPVESRKKIFEKFGATEMRKDQKYHSVGLGLAFCKLSRGEQTRTSCVVSKAGHCLSARPVFEEGERSDARRNDGTRRQVAA